MTRFTDQLHTEAQDIRLTGAERRRILMNLRKAMTPVPSPFFVHIQALFAPRYAFAGLAVFVLAFTGTAYASQGALPGDVLYPVKVGVAEPLAGSIAFTDDAKVAWHTDVAETRLAEAEALTEEGTLTPETGEELAKQVQEHKEAVATIAHDAEDPVSEDKFAARFSARIAQKGSALLAAGKRTDNPIAMRASGDLVVQVASDSDDAKDEKAEAPQVEESAAIAMDAPVAKRSAMTLMMAVAPENAVAPQAAEEPIADLAARAHEALENAHAALAAAALSDDVSAEAEARLAKLESRAVKADAELQLEDEASARTDFTAVIDDVADLVSYVSDHDHDDEETSWYGRERDEDGDEDTGDDHEDSHDWSWKGRW